MSPNDHSCPICTQSMGNEIWCVLPLLCLWTSGMHPDHCGVKNEVEKVKQQQQIVAWKETMQHQFEGWKKASIFAAGTLSTIVVAAGAAAASSTGEQLQQATAEARSASLTADDSAKAATQNFLSLPLVPEPTSRIYQTHTINAKVTSRYCSCGIRFWILCEGCLVVRTGHGPQAEVAQVFGT